VDGGDSVVTVMLDLGMNLVNPPASGHGGMRSTLWRSMTLHGGPQKQPGHGHRRCRVTSVREAKRKMMVLFCPGGPTYWRHNEEISGGFGWAGLVGRFDGLPVWLAGPRSGKAPPLFFMFLAFSFSLFPDLDSNLNLLYYFAGFKFGLLLKKSP
jgi:hypothetical protein